jgi:hypothetical protein
MKPTPLSQVGLKIPIEAIMEADIIYVSAQTVNFEKKEILPHSPVMEFKITKEQKDRLAILEPVLIDLCISCEPDPWRGTVHQGRDDE